MVGGDSDGRIMIWDLLEKTHVFEKLMLEDRVLDVGFVKPKDDPKWVVGLGRDSTIRLFETRQIGGSKNE